MKCLTIPARLLLIALLLKQSWSCPTSCVCKWKNGKQTVECIEKGLLIIPDGMDSGTQVLEFSGNNLHTLHKEKFVKMDLINLQRIYLSKCSITSIDDQTFKGLTNLVELDLSGNLLEIVPSESFTDCVSLMRLTLSYNPIKAVRSSAFGHLGFLNTLELSNCEISQVDEGAFVGLHSLEWLHLNGNKLRTIRGNHGLPDNLKGIELQGNMWECDCHLLDLHAWLESFSIPHSVEPICNGPPRLIKQPVKSIATHDLACLPDVTPTTFYLEIGEGKNVSLLCHINAIPEAHVSWWFQGQLLQNDTMVTADTRLIYYIEEGSEDKKSELFIYNTNTQDNGTFVCTAENAAGLVQSNYTIRVILKEEHNYEVVALPFEFLLIIMSATGVSVLVILFAIILSIIKCRSNRKTKKRQHFTINNSTKDSLLQDSCTEEYSEMSKVSSNITLVDRQQIVYNPNEELISTPPMITSHMNPSISYYEQNPDLINDMESMGRRHEGDGEDKCTEVTELSNVAFFQSNESHCNRDLYRLSADVHLSPVGLLHVNSRSGPFTGSCYRTLPYNKSGKRQTAANPALRFTREAEFLSRVSPQHAAYEHYDIRYTADGYPVRNDETQFSDTESVRSCCSAPAVQWPSCVPASILRNTCEEPHKKCVVGAQTQTDIAGVPQNLHKPINKSVLGVVNIGETLTESPDEGYEGDETQQK